MITKEDWQLQESSPQEGFDLPAYEEHLHNQGVRTGRHAAAMGLAPEVSTLRDATVAIRKVIRPMFDTEPGELISDKDLEQTKAYYWSRAARVGAEHGAVPAFELDDYFRVGEHRSYFAIRQELLERNPEGTLGHDLIGAVDLYHTSLDLNPAIAAGVLCELISRGRGNISHMAARHTDISPTEATRLAFGDFLAEVVPSHIAALATEYGKGEVVERASTKQSFYPKFEAAEAEAALAISSEDMRAIVDVFDIQNRPYSRAELAMGNDIAQTGTMQQAMIGVHERLMDMCTTYLQNHPERMTGNMASWSEIFIPEAREDGSYDLLPNPKLLRAMANNVLPAVASRLLSRGVDINEITADDIEQGVQTASRRFKLLQAKVGLFRTNQQSGTVELGEITTITCPANQLFPSFLSQYLGSDYAQLAGLESVGQQA